MIIVVILDVVVLRTRVATTGAFWLSLTIMWAFQVLVDGWLTKLSSPIVIYNEERFSGVRILSTAQSRISGSGSPSSC